MSKQEGIIKETRIQYLQLIEFPEKNHSKISLIKGRNHFSIEDAIREVSLDMLLSLPPNYLDSLAFLANSPYQDILIGVSGAVGAYIAGKFL